MTGVWTHVLTVTNPALYQLSYTTIPRSLFGPNISKINYVLPFSWLMEEFIVTLTKQARLGHIVNY